eukprot:6176607-Pleurochrysis_carterae.AAC.1
MSSRTFARTIFIGIISKETLGTCELCENDARSEPWTVRPDADGREVTRDSQGTPRHSCERAPSPTCALIVINGCAYCYRSRRAGLGSCRSCA